MSGASTATCNYYPLILVNCYKGIVTVLMRDNQTVGSNCSVKNGRNWYLHINFSMVIHYGLYDCSYYVSRYY